MENELRRDIVIRRVTRRLIPFAFICYVVAYIDRVNIAFAARVLQQDLGLSATQYGIGAGLFFLGYCLFEIPSNLVLERVGARLWIARIMIVWGLVSMATMFVTDVGSFYIARVVLGIAEAGFFPGMVLYLTYWIPAADRARTNALFMTAAPVSAIIGAPISEGLLSLNGMMGLHGWQWLFLVEGLPAVVLGVVAFFYLDDGPERASWLPDDERQWVMNAIQRERSSAEGASAHTIRAGLLNPAVWRFALVLFLIVTSGYGFSFFLPQIVKRLSGASDLAVGLWTAVPFTAAAIGMITVAAHSDRTGERRRHVAACAALAATGLAASSFSGSPVVALALLAAAAVGLYSATPPFWSLPTAFLRGDGAAAGIGLINSIGNLGGFVGPYLMGWMQGLFGDFRVGLRVLAASALLSGVLVLFQTRRVR